MAEHRTSPNGRRGTRRQSPRWLCRLLCSLLAAASLPAVYAEGYGQAAGGCSELCVPPSDDSTGITATEGAVIGVAAGFGVWYGLTQRRHHKELSPARHGGSGAAAPLSEAAGSSRVRLVAYPKELSTGETCTVDLQLRDAAGWRSVTSSSGAWIVPVQAGTGLVPLDRSKNCFALPLTAPLEPGGRRVEMIGTLRLAGSQALTARCSLQLQPTVWALGAP